MSSVGVKFGGHPLYFETTHIDLLLPARNGNFVIDFQATTTGTAKSVRTTPTVGHMIATPCVGTMTLKDRKNSASVPKDTCRFSIMIRTKPNVVSILIKLHWVSL